MLQDSYKPSLFEKVKWGLQVPILQIVFQPKATNIKFLFLKMKLILFPLLFVLIFADTCGGNCPSDLCPICWCGTQKKIVDISEQCQKYNWNQACCKCIMARQSGGNANAMSYNQSSSSWSVGLWQHGTNYRTYCNEAQNPPCSIQANMNCAIALYKNWNGRWNGWSTAAKACGCYTQTVEGLVQ